MARLATAILLAAALLQPGVVKAQSSGGSLSDLFGGIFSGRKSDAPAQQGATGTTASISGSTNGSVPWSGEDGAP